MLDASAEANEEFLQIAEISEGGLSADWNRHAGGFAIRSDVRPTEGRAGRAGEPWLVPLGDGFECVLPLKHPGLLDAFVRLGRSPTDRRILAFANEYGFLREPVRLECTSGKPTVGESLVAWRYWSGVVATMCQLAEWVEFEDAASLTPYVEWFTAPRGVAFKIVGMKGRPKPDMTARMITARPYFSVAPAMPRDAFYDGVTIAEEGSPLIRRFRRGDTIGPARQYLAWRANTFLNSVGGVSRILTPDGDIRYFPRTLLAAIIVRLQDATSGRRLPERECPYTWGRKGRHTFKPTRRDKEYCSDSCRKLYVKGGRNG